MTEHHGRRAARPLATGMMAPPSTATRRIIIPMKLGPSGLFADARLVSVAKDRIAWQSRHFERFSEASFTCQQEARCLSFEG